MDIESYLTRIGALARSLALQAGYRSGQGRFVDAHDGHPYRFGD